MSTTTGKLESDRAADGFNWRITALSVCLGLACVAAYANSLAVPFLFDDQGAILENRTIRSLGDLRQVLSPPHGGETVDGRPFLNFSFALNYAGSGLYVWSWHAVNIAIHILAGLCLFGVVRRTLLSQAIPENLQQRATCLAYAIALLWVVHPLQTESVTYIVQRAESLVGLLMLLTLYGSIRAEDSPRRMAWQTSSVTACALGMATKEVMVAAPLLVFLYDWTFSGNSLRVAIQRRWGFYLCLTATWGVLAALFAKSFERGGTTGFGQGVTSWEYARTQFGFILHYLKLSVWPHPLVLDYGEQIATEPGKIIAAAIPIAALVAATFAAFCRPSWRPLAFLGAWFLCILAPSSSVIPVITQTGAEHRMYLPLAAVVTLLVLTADCILRKFSRAILGPDPTRARLLQPTCVGLGCVVALALAVVTARRNLDYHSALSIWHDTVEKCPQNWRALSGLGDEYADAGELSKAIELYDRSIAIYPRHAVTFNSRGSVWLELGDRGRAKRDFQQALAINPRYGVPYTNLGIAEAADGNLDKALVDFSEAVKLDPASAAIRRHRGVVLVRLRRHAAAIEDFSEAVRLDPQFDKAYNDRGHCFQATGRLREALADFSRAIEINPREAAYYQNRGIVLGMAGRFEESVGDCSTALKLKPDFVDAYRTRAISYMNLKRFDLARADFAHMERLGSPPDSRLVERLERESQAASAPP